MIAGIDPGKHGALFLLGPPHGYATVPLVKIDNKDKPDYDAWWRIWYPLLLDAEHIMIEFAAARPGQGVTSMFSFGYCAGFIRGLVLSTGRPHTLIPPQMWKKLAGLRGSNKDESRCRASQLVPEAVDFWLRKKDDGIAEAALIALSYRLMESRILRNGELI
ncbi:MAG: hypothetical protein KGJ13_08615 [Patescibacteria group bacterium]|nr:hypothetical protein [Patescibacteria group bacterium]